MRQDTAMIAVVSLLLTVVTVGSSPLPAPLSCGHSVQTIDRAQCVYGVTRDSCNNMVCLKGPSERCGGKYGR